MSKLERTCTTHKEDTCHDCMEVGKRLQHMLSDYQRVEGVFISVRLIPEGPNGCCTWEVEILISRPHSGPTDHYRNTWRASPFPTERDLSRMFTSAQATLERRLLK